MTSDPKEILNWRRVDDRITLSGQPTKAQFDQIAALGVSCVINLAPAHNDNAIPDEGDHIAALGQAYVYIPVEFDDPTEQDYAAFCAAMDFHRDAKVHVHCIYNARVSAFMLRYARDAGAGVDAAAQLMEGIWRPGGVWAKFLNDPANEGFANRYAGYDY